MLKLKKLGGKVRAYREDRKLKQVDLAVAVRISPSYVSAIESGLRHPSLKVIEKIAKVLRVPLKEFFD